MSEHRDRLLLLVGHLAGQRAVGRAQPQHPSYADLDRLLHEVERITKGAEKPPEPR